MHTINIIVKNTPLPISIERKELEDAEKVYQQIIAAMKGSSTQILELTCEKQEGKKVALASDAIAAAILAQNSGANTNRAAGFFAATTVE
jgi:hypothetical protein